MNINILEGNLATEPELRAFGQDRHLCKFLIAVTRQPGKPEMGKDLIRVIAWDKTAVNCARYLSKGSRVLIVGKTHSEFYKKDESATAKLNTEVYADNVTFLSPPPNGASAAPAAAPAGRGR